MPQELTCFLAQVRAPPAAAASHPRIARAPVREAAVLKHRQGGLSDVTASKMEVKILNLANFGPMASQAGLEADHRAAVYGPGPRSSDRWARTRMSGDGRT